MTKVDLMTTKKKGFNKTFLIYSLFLILFSLNVVSIDYRQVGGENSDFVQDRGYFTSLTNVTTATRAISDPRQTPLIRDLDKDGINEIIILDGSTIRLYHGASLTIVDAQSLPASDRYSNMITFDIDNDNLIEIIIARETAGKIDIFEYNGTDFQIETTLDYSGLTDFVDGETIIGCSQADRCMLAYIKNDNSLGASVPDRLYATSFNSLQVNKNETLIYQTGLTPPQVLCMPKIRALTLTDYDNDGEEEFIFSYITGHTTGTESYHISYIYLNSSNEIEHEYTINKSMQNLIDSGTLYCGTQYSGDTLGDFITAPLVFDIDGATSNGYETVVGVQLDLDEFKIHSYSSNGVQMDTYPALFDADGTMISNPIRATIDPDAPQGTDFCVMGYQDEIGEIDLLCATEQGGGIFDPESDEFEFDISGYYNISDNITFYNNMIHSAQHSTATTDGVDLSEIITPYGIFTIDYDGNNELLMHYENPKSDGVVLSIDVEQVGRDDLIVLTPTNLWYLNDGFTKSPGEIDSYIINPCIDSTWKQNTTVSVSITVVDADGDDVSARAILYEGETFEQDSGWSFNGSSGTTFTHSFVANETVGSAKLVLYARDDDFVTQIDEIELSISVGADGVEYGECETNVDVTTSIEEGGEEDVLEEDNMIATSVDQINDVLGAGLSRGVWWLLFMVVVAVGIWVKGEGYSDKSSILGVIGIVEILLFILGLKLSFFGVGSLLIVIILSLALIAFKWNPWSSGG